MCRACTNIACTIPEKENFEIDSLEQIMQENLKSPASILDTRPPPQRDPILSFSHTFSSKSTCVRHRHPQ